MPLRRSASILVLILVALSTVRVALASGGSPGSRSADASAAPPMLGSIGRQFFVASNSQDSPIITLGVAEELRKSFGMQPWVLAEPGWSSDNIVKECDDPNTIGGVVLVYYSGFATHFYLLWQSQTTTLIVNALVISCHRASTPVSPTIVAVIGETPGSHHTPWMVRSSQVSIPLITLAGVGSLLSKNATSSKTGTTTITLSTIAATVFTQASSHDIPGYSEPVRLRHTAQHIGVDLVHSMQDLCTTVGDLSSPDDYMARANFCKALGYPTEPTHQPMP